MSQKPKVRLKNEKLSFISSDKFILGCYTGSETHFARNIDTTGRDLSKPTFEFINSLVALQSEKEWTDKKAVVNDKMQIVLGLEPTGHHCFCLATQRVSSGISGVKVNQYVV